MASGHPAVEPAPRGRGRPAGSGSTSRTKSAILHSAREVFGEVGYERTAIRDIAERAGVTRPAVSHHFPGKDALYRSLLDAVVRDMAAVGRATAAVEDDPRKKIEAFLTAAISIDASDRSITRFVAASLVDSFRYQELRDGADAQLDEVRSFLRGVLRDGIRAGTVDRALDVDATVEMLVATMWGMALYAAFIGSNEQLETAATQFGRLLDGTLW